jgi:hypothetical protein
VKRRYEKWTVDGFPYLVTIELETLEMGLSLSDALQRGSNQGAELRHGDFEDPWCKEFCSLMMTSLSLPTLMSDTKPGGVGGKPAYPYPRQISGISSIGSTRSCTVTLRYAVR